MEPHEALVREALDACTGPALALDARGRVLAANAALLVRLGISGEAVNSPTDRLRVSGPALTRRRRAPAALDVHVTGRAPARFQATVRRDASCGRLLVALRDDDTPAPAATLLERQLDLREHVGDDPSDFFHEATETLAETLAVERAAIWLFDDDGASLVCADRYVRSQRRHERGDLLVAADHPEYFHAATERRAIVAMDVDDDPATRSFAACRLAPTGVRALVDVAIRSGANLRGMLCIGHVGAPREWRPEDVKFALGVANQAMIAIAEAERRQAEATLRGFAASLERRVEERTAELAAAERQGRELLATLDATIDGAFVFDPTSLRFTYANAGAVRQSGFAREELLCMTPLDLAQDVDEGAFRRLLDALRHGERQTATLAAVHRRRDGGALPVEVVLQLVAPDDAEPRFLAIARDVTDRLRTERAARRAERLQSLGTLAGGVAHDLNNALTPVLVAAEELRGGGPADPAALDLLEQSARRAIDMVRQLLQFAKGQEGRCELLSARRLVDEIARIAKATFPKHVVTSAECAADLPPVRGDGTQLHQVLLNLAINARDAMPAGGRLRFVVAGETVGADFRAHAGDARPGDYVVLRVQDDGVGIPADVLDRIFEPFFTTKGPDKGTGLGLSTTLGIVRSHGGFVHVHSTPGVGSTFAVYLPAGTAANASAHAPAARPADVRLLARAGGQGGALLFVDDEAIVLRTAERLFRRLGFEIVACDGVDAALAALQDEPSRFRGLITDLHMPKQDGCDLLAAARHLAPGLPVAVATGFLDDAAQRQLADMGVRHVLDKPFDQAALARFLADFGRGETGTTSA
jgi:PAS domain S-box-containing protein